MCFNHGIHLKVTHCWSFCSKIAMFLLNDFYSKDKIQSANLFSISTIYQILCTPILANVPLRYFTQCHQAKFITNAKKKNCIWPNWIHFSSKWTSLLYFCFLILILKAKLIISKFEPYASPNFINNEEGKWACTIFCFMVI